jgi:uncharacterized membrane protein YcaP (DUF421 family)
MKGWMQLIMSIWQEYVKDWQAHTKEEFIIQVISIVLILLLGMVAVKLIGKKSVARLNLLDVLFIFVLSSTLGALITNPKRIFVALLVVTTIIIFVRFLQWLQLKINNAEKFIQGMPEVIYENSQFKECAMKKNNLTVDTVESIIRQHGLPSIDVVDLIILETTGTLSFQVKPEYEPIKKIYFDEAMKQIMQALNEKYTEAKPPEMNNAFQEVVKVKPSLKKKVPKNLE